MQVAVVEKLNEDIGRDALRREKTDDRRLTFTDGDTEIRRFEGDDRSLVVRHGSRMKQRKDDQQVVERHRCE